MKRLLVVAAAAALALAATASSTADAPGPPLTDPNEVINLPAGYSYTVLSTSCLDTVQSTESGLTFPMPEDFDANILFNAGGEDWLLNHHELTQPRPGDFQGDAGKCAVPEQSSVDDGDSDGDGSISRLVLAKDGTTVLRRELITTGLHDNCAAAVTPWNTFLTNEEFPFINDPEQRSGWVWEIDPATGAEKRLTGMGRFSHEQEAYAANGSWYLTDDRGDARFIYKFVPDRRRDLTTGKLYGLAFNHATMTGTWIGPLDPLDPDADMRAHGFQPSVWGFTKAEGIIGAAGSQGVGGSSLTMSESSAGGDPGRIWRFTQLGGATIRGEVLVEGDFGRLSRPDNMRYTDAGDLFLMEDHSGGDFTNHPETGNQNDIWILPRGKQGADNLILFATLPHRFEPTGPWFSNDNRVLYLSIQADPPFHSRVIAISREGGNFNQPYDR
jgi:Bacterial protein of unknown function (DUF839)